MDLLTALKATSLDLIPLKTEVKGQTETAYYKPMTLADHDKIKRFVMAEGGQGSDGLALALTVIHKVMDKDGKKVFSMKDKNFLMNGIPNSILVALVNEMAAEIDLEEAEGN